MKKNLKKPLSGLFCALLSMQMTGCSAAEKEVERTAAAGQWTQKVNEWKQSASEALASSGLQIGRSLDELFNNPDALASAQDTEEDLWQDDWTEEEWDEIDASTDWQQESEVGNETVNESQTQTTTPSSPSTNQTPSVSNGMTYINGILLVNKKHGLPADYAPGEDPAAKAALMQLITDMKAAGLDVSWDYSGFRSYQTQAQLYNNYVASYGQASADTFSARPGYSEHQTGLAYDLKNTNGQLLTTPAEAAWVAAHAPDYGFIVRYTDANESITGYVAEPWHLRYVGSQARTISSYNSLEEYLGAAGGDYY